MNVRSELPTPDNSSNFNSFGNIEVATTLDALKEAVAGETGASAKYGQYAEAAEANGFSQAARLFRAASAAEQVHIKLEAALVEKFDEDWERPVAEPVDVPAVDLCLIDAAKGEIFEASEMYPSFIDLAQEEGNDEAVKVFTKAKLAESVHAELYLNVYNNLDAADDDDFWLCPVCGYIEKGEFAPESCPICGAPAKVFKQF